MQNKFQYASIVFLMSASGISQAALNSSSGAIAFSGSSTLSASSTSQASVSASNNNAAIATVGLGQFDAATGVLLGADISLTSNRNQSLVGTGYKNNGPGRDANGSGNSTASLSAPGANVGFTSAISLAGSGCSLAMGPTGYISCGWGPSNAPATPTNANTSVDSANLNDYVGGGSTNASLQLPSMGATTTLSRTQGQTSGSTTTYTVNWEGSIQADYSYLLHADGSFNAANDQNSLTLDFGTVLQNSASPTLSFSIFNLANADRNALDLDSVTGSGDTAGFNSGLSNFLNLAQGDGILFTASMLTDTIGSLSAQYIINLSDADIGASNTWQNQQLTLNLVGNVAPVPVPGAAWLFGSALGLFGFLRRKARA